jgi:hypothetical protein
MVLLLTFLAWFRRGNASFGQSKRDKIMPVEVWESRGLFDLVLVNADKAN